MNAEPKISEPDEIGPPQTGLLATAYEGLGQFAERMEKLETAVDALADGGSDAMKTTARKLKRQIREFEPSVTMIGQVKAGKTTLVNALIGWPEVLPADINPWTSVVTSLHLDPRGRSAARKANFRFFDEEEWDRLVQRGGRIGELASRAGAHKELEKVRAQLEEMREKSRRRLGRKFEMLMGQGHEYGYFDADLIQRYVCLGDDHHLDDGSDPQQGRYADITKSADLFIGQPEVPHRLCIRDTPGVNDTFMIREQITVNAIRESRLCVVVLSAHQTLSTVDMALIRLISNIKSREVIIFVNRIDELGDPVRETQEIEQSIKTTLKDLNGPTDAQIIFGSAYWANHALREGYGDLNDASGEALVKWAGYKLPDDKADPSVDAMVWQLSGVPELCAAIAERVRQGEGAEFEDRVVRSARNVANTLSASRKVVSQRMGGQPMKPVAREEIGQELDVIAKRCEERLDATLQKLANDLDTRLSRSRKSFLARATAALVRHLETRGEAEVWNYEPTGLRLLLRSGYQVFASKATKASEDALMAATSEIRDLYIAAFELPETSVALEAPTAPSPPPPVILGSTIALDVKGNWWTRWWRKRRSYSAFAGEFAEFIDAEIEPIVSSLRTDHADPYFAEVRAVLVEFIATQRTHLIELAEQTDVSIDQLREKVGKDGREQWDALKSTFSLLSEFKHGETEGATP